MQDEQFKKGDLVIVPQRVLMTKGTAEAKYAAEPTLGLFLESYNYFSEVLINNEIWTIETHSLNKGEKHASKNDRSL